MTRAEKRIKAKALCPYCQYQNMLEALGSTGDEALNALVVCMMEHVTTGHRMQRTAEEVFQLIGRVYYLAVWVQVP